MDLLFFFYTVGLIGLAFVACSVSIMVRLMTGRRDCIVAAIGFAFYALDISLIFFDEYSRAKYSYAETFQQPLTHPGASLMLGFSILACLWIWTLWRTHSEVTTRNLGGYLIPLLVLMAAFLPREGASGTVRQYLYWLVRDCGMIACLVYAAWSYRRSPSNVVRLDLERSKGFFRIALALMMCVIIEDTAMIMIVRPSVDNVVIGRFLWHLQERNLSENVLMAVVAFHLFRRYKEILTVYARRPRTEDIDSGPMSIEVEDMETRLVLFAEGNSLSPRETDVLRLLVRGLDAQNIASELVISLGTVKAHLHRIYTKVGVKSKKSLLQRFWTQ
ncbi:MAG: LuxR C-terminal-related transcriptional regulator [Collinsella sp.]|nr:LuxR C-terminal-related transcriptional regulator [Collinsella sp.]